MSGHSQIAQTVRAGRRYELWLRSEAARRAALPPEPVPTNPVQAARSRVEGHAEIHPHDLGAWVSDSQRSPAGDRANTVITNRLETGLFPSVAQLAGLRETLLANVNTETPAEYVYSGRRGYARAWPLQSTAETDGYLLGVDVRAPETDRIGVRERSFQALAAAAWSRRMRTAAELRADLAAVRPFIGEQSIQDFLARETEAAAREREQVIGDGLGRLGRDMTMALPLTAGRWQMGVTCPFVYHRWNQWTPAQYKVTAEPRPGGESVDRRFNLGFRQSADVRVFLAPRRHQIIGQYFALYLFLTLFWFNYSHSVSTFAYVDRLPVGFGGGSLGNTGINDVAMSRWISGSARYALAIVQDAALQFVTPYSSKILVGRVDGRWTIREVTIPAGELLAVVDIRHPVGAPDRFYVWQVENEPRANTLVDWGRLHTQEVTPHPGYSDWSFTPPYQPL
jgi:hypothetical protein